MGSSTVRRFSRFTLCLLFALSFFSCESADDSGLAEDGPRASAATHSVDSLVQLKLLVPDVEGKGSVQLRSNEQLKQVLQKHVAAEPVRAQGEFNFDSVPQQINPSSPSSFFIASLSDDPDEPAFGPFANQLFNSRSANIGGATILNPAYPDELEEEPEVYSARTTWTYRQTEGTGSAGKIGVVMTDLDTPNAAILEGGDGTVTIVAEWTGTTLDPDDPSNRDASYDVTVSVQGVTVYQVQDVVRENAGTVSDFPIFPVFESPGSGTYKLTVEDSYTLPGSATHYSEAHFTQKGLVLAEPLLDYTLEPGDPLELNNSFAWDYEDDPTNLQRASWDVLVTNPAGVEVGTFSGTGRTITATIDTGALGAVGEFRLKPKGQDIPDGGTPIYSYEIVIRALAYDKTSTRHKTFDNLTQTVPSQDVFYEVSSAVAPTELKIINVELDPDPPFQNEGDSVDLTAEILAVGFENLTEDDVDWWVELVDPAGNTVGDPLATGTGFAVTATWNGRVDGQPVEGPGAYSLRIRATTCGGTLQRAGSIRAQQLCQEDFFDVELRKVSSIKVFDRGKKLLGSSFLSVLFPNPDEQASLDERLRLLGLVHRLDDEFLVVEVSGLEFKDAEGKPEEPPQTLKLQAKSMVSGVTLPGEGEVLEGELVSNSEASGAAYKLEFRFPENFVKSGATLGQTRYSVGEIFTTPGMSVLIPGIAQVVKSVVEGSNLYGGPRAGLGVFDEAASDPKDFPNKFPEGEPGPGQAEATEENVLTTGFEALEFRVIDPKVRDLGPALVKIRQPANVLVWNFHGDEYGVLGLSSGRDSHFKGSPEKARLDRVLRPSAELSLHMVDVKTLILSSCSALNVGDFNNNYVGPLHPGPFNLTGVDVWPGGSLRQFGGARWDEMTGSGAYQTVLLGYNGPAPFNEGDPETGNLAARVLELYQAELQSLSGVGAGVEQQWAWMAANVKFANSAKDENDIRWLTLNASALDAQYYYYIPHLVDRSRRIDLGERPDPGPEQTANPFREPSGVPAPDFRSIDKERPVWRIPRSRWGEAAGDWEQNSELGEPVPIPGVTYTPPTPANL